MRYWKRIDHNGLTTTVESYSHDLGVEGAIEIDKAEFDAYIASLPVTTPEPLVFAPANPEFGVEQRTAQIEEFLKRVYPE